MVKSLDYRRRKLSGRANEALLLREFGELCFNLPLIELAANGMIRRDIVG
jgi:hypothetical protein